MRILKASLKGFLTIIFMMLSVIQITRFWSVKEHNHTNDINSPRVAKVRRQVKRKAAETAEPPGRLLAEALMNSSTAVRENKGNLETIRRDSRVQ